MRTSQPSNCDPEEEDWWQLSLDHRSAGRVTAALVAMERFRARHPRDKWAEVIYAELLTATGRLHEAHQVLSHLRPSGDRRWLFGYHTACVELSQAQGNLKDEALWSRKLIDELPDSSHGYIYLGCCLARQGRLVEAEDAFRRGTDCVGCPEEAFMNLGRVLCGQGRFAEAKEAFESALATDENYEEAANSLEDVSHALKLAARIRIYDAL